MATTFFLQVSTFAGFDPDASHYMGELVWYVNQKRECWELAIEISTKEAISLNKSDGTRGASQWKKGDKSTRFSDEASLIKYAILQFEKISQPGDVLLKGSAACLDPQWVLAGPGKFVSQGNRLRKVSETIDFYEKYPHKMEKIYESWAILKKQFNLQ